MIRIYIVSVDGSWMYDHNRVYSWNLHYDKHDRDHGEDCIHTTNHSVTSLCVLTSPLTMLLVTTARQHFNRGSSRLGTLQQGGVSYINSACWLSGHYDEQRSSTPKAFIAVPSQANDESNEIQRATKWFRLRSRPVCPDSSIWFLLDPSLFREVYDNSFEYTYWKKKYAKRRSLNRFQLSLSSCLRSVHP